MKHPSSAVAEMTMADQAVALAAELGLDGSSVFFNRDWVPYDERLAWFAEADLGVSAHRDSFEARLAFRTRLLDHIAGGTPLVVTRGDVLADLVQSRGMGRALAPGDVDGWTVALDGAARRRSGLRGGEEAVQAAQEELSWSRDRRAAGGVDRAGRGRPRERRPPRTRSSCCAAATPRPLVARPPRSPGDRRRRRAGDLQRRRR